MKRVILLLMMCLPVMAFAQDGGGSDVVVGFSLTTFTGIVAVVAFAITELGKMWKLVADNRFAKIGTAVVLAVALCLGVWFIGITGFLTGLSWWQVALQGLLAGLSACGFYDILKGVGIVGKTGG